MATTLDRPHGAGGDGKVLQGEDGGRKHLELVATCGIMGASSELIFSPSNSNPERFTSGVLIHESKYRICQSLLNRHYVWIVRHYIDIVRSDVSEIVRYKEYCFHNSR